MIDPTDSSNETQASNSEESSADLASLALSEMGEALFRLSAFDVAAGKPPMERRDDLEHLFEQIDRDLVRQASCSCAKIRDYLSSDETLGDVKHICPEIARNSCFDWLSENWISALDVTTLRVRVPLDLGRFTDATNIDQWPIPLKDETRVIYAVIRQLAEESPNERSSKLAAVLQAHTQWNPMIMRLQDRLKRISSASDDPKHNLPNLEHLRSADAGWFGIGTVLQELGWAGLPRTEATASYVLSQLDGKTRQDPSRGALVTTFLICSTQFFSDRNGIKVAETEEAIQRITWTTPWITSKLVAQASRTAERHARWWKELAGVQVPESNIKGRLIKEEGKLLSADVNAMIAGTLTEPEVRIRARQRLAEIRGREISLTEGIACDRKVNSMMSKAKRRKRR